MLHAAWGAMLADALHRQVVHPRQRPHPRTISMSSDACGRPSMRPGRRKVPVEHHPKPTRIHRHRPATPPASTHGHRQQRRSPDLLHPGNPARHTT